MFSSLVGIANNYAYKVFSLGSSSWEINFLIFGFSYNNQSPF
jgi:hypothetical protein